jgi:glycosyltransferase involved in cell wall biosynthesis
MSEGLRILVAHQVPSARTGGMSRIMGFIHDRLIDHGHQVDYFCADDVPPRWQTGIGRRFAFPLLVRTAAAAAARRGMPYDIVNVHEPHALPLTLQRASTGSPAVVVTSHGLERRAWDVAKEDARLGRSRIPAKTRLTYPMTSLWPASWGLRRADHVFCLNRDDRDYLLRWLHRPEDTVTRIFPGADLAYLNDARTYETVERILFAAAWRDNKGIADLVPAFVRLAERHPRLTLVVLGAGVPDATVRRRFPHALHQRIACDTPSTEADMAAAFAGADLFLLPSLFEGTPLTLVQAMMSGLPIVTTQTCGMKDVIANDESGLLVPIRSPEGIVGAVERLVNDRSLRERLGRSARAQALAHYSWEQAAAPVEQVYLGLRRSAAR